MAASMIHLLPMIILFLIAQRYFIRGITSSGLKD
jgi:ABC-type glycerol-3-phosphate transport system permease component